MDLSVAIELENSLMPIPTDKHFKLYAGPGAGKTTFLTNHIKRILTQSSRLGKVRKIACITYTSAGVNMLKNKLEESVETLEICTIHSFCYKHIVKPYIWLLKENLLPIGKIDGHEEIILRKSQLNQFKSNSQQNYLDDIKLAKALSKLKWVVEDEVPKLTFIKNYERQVGDYWLKENSYLNYKDLYWSEGRLSHDDVLYFAYKILMQEEKIRKVIRAKFPYILIDEFQDTSPLQTEIIKIIAQQEVCIGIVGDLCQSIYAFQGANVADFENFTLKNMQLYTLKGNHRSSTEIIKVLNHMRKLKDFEQFSPNNKTGNKPVILIGKSKKAYSYLKGLEDLSVLSYKNEISLNSDGEMGTVLEAEFNIIIEDSNRDRGWMIFYVIQSIEYAKQLKIKEALKSMKIAYRKYPAFTDKDAFMNLKRLLADFNKYANESITFFNNNYIYKFHNVNGKISSGATKAFYDGLTYVQVVYKMKILDDLSEFKTIHQSKGSEFENVLLILSESGGNELKFLISPNMDQEAHRVFYVALSRAKSGMYINVPKITESNQKVLREIGFDFVNVDYDNIQTVNLHFKAYN